MPSTPNKRALLLLLSVASLIAIAGCMLSLSWLRWPDALVDFGDELYTAWQITEGRALYRDIIYTRGPLSPYLNALAMWGAGPSLWSIVGVNMLVVVGVATLLYVFFHRRGGIPSATVTTGCFLLLFAFPQYEHNGSYNFAAPYAHEQTHAILLALASILAFENFLRDRRSLWLIVAGAGCGLTFLTKPELFVALTAAIGVGLAADFFRCPHARQRGRRSLVLLLLAASVPLVIFWLMLRSQLSSAEAWLGVSRGWVSVWQLRDLYYSESPLARSITGFDHIERNLMMIAGELVVYALVFAVACALNRLLGNWRDRRLWALMAFGATTFALMQLEVDHFWWLRALRALPFATAIFGILAIRNALFAQSSPETRSRAIGTLVFTTYALALLTRVVLNTRVAHYGFSLALPATVLFFHMAVHDGARFAARRVGSYAVYMGVILACLGVLVGHHVVISQAFFKWKDYSVASTFLSYLPQFDSRGVIINRALEWIEDHASPHSSMLVLPEGAMLNFLARRPAPPPFVTFNPVTFSLHGDAAVIRALAANPPDHVLLVHRDNTEHGARFFGTDFGKKTARWVHRHYAEQVTYGMKPFSGRSFGISILARRNLPQPVERTPNEPRP